MAKHCPVIFSAVLFFCFSRNNACKSAGFPEPALAAEVGFADSTQFGKTKALFGNLRMLPGKTLGVCIIMLYVENERETSELK